MCAICSREPTNHDAPADLVDRAQLLAGLRVLANIEPFSQAYVYGVLAAIAYVEDFE